MKFLGTFFFKLKILRRFFEFSFQCRNFTLKLNDFIFIISLSFLKCEFSRKFPEYLNFQLESVIFILKLFNSLFTFLATFSRFLTFLGTFSQRFIRILRNFSEISRDFLTSSFCLVSCKVCCKSFKASSFFLSASLKSCWLFLLISLKFQWKFTEIYTSDLFWDSRRSVWDCLRSFWDFSKS